MKDGGLMENNRQNEPNKLPIFGAYQLPTQRGEESNFIMVLSRLVGSGVMFLFLCDSTRVLSKPTSSRATPNMEKNTLKILSLRAKIPFPT